MLFLETAHLLCLDEISAALGEWHGETWFRRRT